MGGLGSYRSSDGFDQDHRLPIRLQVCSADFANLLQADPNVCFTNFCRSGFVSPSVTLRIICLKKEAAR